MFGSPECFVGVVGAMRRACLTWPLPQRLETCRQETQGFLAPKSIEMLKLGLRNQYGDERPESLDTRNLLFVEAGKSSGKLPRV